MTPSMAGRLRHALLALACSALAACGGSDSAAPVSDPAPAPTPPPASGPAPTPPPPVPPTLARIDVTPARLSLAPGQTAVLSARSIDNNGAPIAAVVTWQSSDATKVVIENDIARAVADGGVTITALSGTVMSSPVPVRVAAPAASAGLIEAALAAGTIDATTALKYRVFAAYNDPRLPFEYLGNQRSRHESFIGRQLALAFPRMSEADQLEMAPFMLPPIYADSWLGQREAALQAATQSTPLASSTEVLPTFSQAVNRALASFKRPPGSTSSDRVRPMAIRRPVCSGLVTRGWEKFDSEHFRVWFDRAKFPDDAGNAQIAAGFMEESYTRLIALGMRVPLSDQAFPCNGGDGRIDLYLVKDGDSGTGGGALGVTEPMDSAAATSAQFMVVTRNVVDDPLFFGTVAHEYMHVVQGAYENNMNMPDEALLFIADATSDWAIDHIRRDNNSERLSAPFLLDHIGSPLWASSHDLKRYGGYLFFQFVARMRDSTGNGYGGPDVVKVVWDRIAAQPQDRPADMLAALDGALPRGLTATWNDFAVAAWNQGPVNRFEVEDGLKVVARTDRVEEVTASTPGGLIKLTPSVSNGLPVELQELSFRTERFTFPDDAVSTVTFFNGHTYGLKAEVIPITNTSFDPPQVLSAGETLVAYAPNGQERGPNRALTALIRIGGQWTLENWTDRAIRYFCRERSAEKVEELVLIYSNGAFSDTRQPASEALNAIGPVFAPPSGLASRLVATQMPCHQFQGTASGSATITANGNNFTVTNQFAGTLRGRPALANGVLNGRPVTLLPGVRFETVSGTLRSSLTGVVAPCRAAPFNFSAAPSVLPDASQTPDFVLLTNYWPGTTANGGYSGGGARTYFGLDPSVCTTGAFIDTPAPAAYTFDALWTAPVADSIFKVDIANRRLKANNVDGPTAFAGSFPPPVITRSSWCFVATREGETPPPGACP